MNNTIANNVQTVRQHYNQFFDLLDRKKLYSEPGWEQRPTIMNLGYWSRGATTAQEAQLEMVHQVASRVPSLKGSRVLDVGCGLAGPASILARDYEAQVDGINIVEQQVTLARQYIEANGLQDRVRVHIGNSMELPFPDESFDIIFCLEAAHCFIDKPRFLAEARRVLQPTGVLLLADITTTTYNPLLSWLPALKLNLVTAQDWYRMLEAGGFSIEHKELIGNSVYPGYLRWVDSTAEERRSTIFNKICNRDTSLLVRQLKQLQTWFLELAFCRSFLRISSWLKFREFVVIVVRKPNNEN
jgi:cyclopropane fatty-acyl-phospholipid synthase-like methyltransferase